MVSTMFRWFVVAALVLGGCAKKPADGALKTGPVIAAVNFESGSVQIPAAEMAAIDKAAEVQKKGSWKVLLVGLADASGDPEANKVLSQQRAETVKAELVKRGVPEARIDTHATGERLADDQDNIQERKVEFVFYTGGAGLTPHKIAVESGAMSSDYHDKAKAKAQ